MKTINIGDNYYQNRKESDIVDFYCTKDGIVIKISTWENENSQIGLEYKFDGFSGFRYLDEGDLISYWEKENFKNNYHLYQILNGGWKSGEVTQPGILEISRFSENPKEFFIKTSNGCFTVLSNQEPSIKKLKFSDL